MLVIRPASHSADLSEDDRLDHWIIPLDGTPLAEDILAPALNLGKVWNADYTLSRVVRPVVPHARARDLGSFSAPPSRKWPRKRTPRRTRRGPVRQVPERRRSGTARRAERRDGRRLHEQPGVAILDNGKPPIDTIAIATHGRGSAALLLGSVADKVIRGSNLPILVHHTKS